MSKKLVPAEILRANGASVEYLPTLRWREVRLPSWASESDRFVACDIVGDSLEPYAHDGDVALIHLTGEVRPGDIAAVLTPIGLLLKRVVLVGYWARLESVNPQALPIWFNAQDIVIQGRVIRTEHDW